MWGLTFCVSLPVTHSLSLSLSLYLSILTLPLAPPLTLTLTCSREGEARVLHSNQTEEPNTVLFGNGEVQFPGAETALGLGSDEGGGGGNDERGAVVVLVVCRGDQTRIRHRTRSRVRVKVRVMIRGASWWKSTWACVQG